MKNEHLRGRRRVRRSQVARKKKQGDPHADLVAALNHPTRVALLRHLLTEESARSPKEMAAALDKPLSAVSYHVRVLEAKNAVELTEEERVRGSVAHFYELTDLIKTTPWVLTSLSA